MYTGLHDVHLVMKVNFSIWKEKEMTTACNFISLGEKMLKLSDLKQEKREEKKRKIIGGKRREMFTLCCSVS